MKYACLDITQSRRIDVVYVDDANRAVHHTTLRHHEVVRWAREMRPDLVAIDGPSKENRGRTREPKFRIDQGLKKEEYENFRVCEMMLKRQAIGLYNTPPAGVAAWIKAGLRVYRDLQNELGYRLWDQPGPVRIELGQPTLIEVHPHACFVVGLGWIPPDKKGLAGNLARTAYLRRDGILGGSPLQGECWPRETMLAELAARLERVTWQALCDEGLGLPEIDHDLIDALAGLVTAIKCVGGSAHAVGEVLEGVIVVPKQPKPPGTPYIRPRRSRTC